MLAEAHPLGRQSEVQAEEEPDEPGEAGQEPQNEPDAHRHLSVGLERRKHAAVREDRHLQEVLIPADGVAGGELGDPLGMKGQEPL